MSSPARLDLLVVIAKTSHEQRLLHHLQSGFGTIRVLSRPSMDQLRQALADCAPRVLICDLESPTLAVRNINALIANLKLHTRIVAAAPSFSTRAVIRAMSQGARDLVSDEDPLHLQLVIARELDILQAWCEQNTKRLSPFMGDNEGHATLEGFRIVDCDSAFAGIFESSSKKLQNTSLLQYLDGDDHHAVKQLLTRGTQGENVAEPTSVRLITSDGTRKRILVSVKASFEDERVSLMLTAQIAPADVDTPAAATATAARAPIDQAVTKRIQNALKQNQLSLVVQPISDLVGEPHRKPSSKLDIYVMLKDSDGELRAGEFIREARASGLIRFVDRWVVHNACKLLHSNLKKQGPVLLFLRLSRQSLHDPTLVYTLRQEVDKQGISPDCLSFELIEADLTNLTDDELNVLREMKQAGFLLSISGLSDSPASLQHLQRLPLDFVKLDPKLAEKVQHSENAKKFVQAIVQAANATHTGVVSTHVPNATAMATLWTLGVHYVQGNYLQEPEIVLRHG